MPNMIEQREDTILVTAATLNAGKTGVSVLHHMINVGLVANPFAAKE